jgi:hypothetical protein
MYFECPNASKRQLMQTDGSRSWTGARGILHVQLYAPFDVTEAARCNTDPWRQSVMEIAKVTCRSIKAISQQKHDAMRKLCSDSQLFEYMRTHEL